MLTIYMHTKLNKVRKIYWGFSLEIWIKIIESKD